MRLCQDVESESRCGYVTLAQTSVWLKSFKSDVEVNNYPLVNVFSLLLKMAHSK